MGQYWLPVNLDKKEFIDPHKMGAGLKLWEQLANNPSTHAGLLILCAAMPESRGGGDFATKPRATNRGSNPRHGAKNPEEITEDYAAIAARTIGRWAGDRIAVVGDYAEDTDLAPEHNASRIYGYCCNAKYPPEDENDSQEEVWLDVSDDVCAVLEEELEGKFVGDGWRHFKHNDEK